MFWISPLLCVVLSLSLSLHNWTNITGTSMAVHVVNGRVLVVQSMHSLLFDWDLCHDESQQLQLTLHNVTPCMYACTEGSISAECGSKRVLHPKTSIVRNCDPVVED